MSTNDFPPLRRKQSGTSPWSVVGGVLLVAVLCGILLWSLGVIHFGNSAPTLNPNAKERETAPRSERNPEEIERIKINKAVTPSVVNIDTLVYTNNGYNLTDEEQRQGTGSGFVWDDEGRIVTNFHVVRDALALNRQGEVVIHPDRKIMATLASKESIQVRLVGIARDSDLAVVQLARLPSGGVKKITVGTSNDLEVGQTVYAIGNPFGQGFTLTHGIISALDRSIQSPSQHIINGVIQTDAALNPGNSGGPLLDKDGRLIGVNTAITSPSGGNIGLGYAIPVDTVNRVVTDLIRTGREAAKPYIGADFVLQEAALRRNGISKGVMIRSVKPSSPAANAGLVRGDLIVKVNGTEIVGLADLESILKQVKIGDTLTLTIRRDRREQDVPVKVEGL